MWKSLPPKLIEEQILVRGGAFRMEYEFAEEGRKKRFFFILNFNPRSDQILVVATATTKIKARRACRPPEVLVELSRRDCPDLDQDSLVDCSSARSWPRDQLIRGIQRKSVQPLSPLPATVMDRLARAVGAAKTLPPKIKRLVLEET